MDKKILRNIAFASLIVIAGNGLLFHGTSANAGSCACWCKDSRGRPSGAVPDMMQDVKPTDYCESCKKHCGGEDNVFVYTSPSPGDCCDVGGRQLILAGSLREGWYTKLNQSPVCVHPILINSEDFDGMFKFGHNLQEIKVSVTETGHDVGSIFFSNP